LKLVWLWLLWIAVFLGQTFAGDWYYADNRTGNLINALLSFGIMTAILSCYRQSWSWLYAVTTVAQISLFYTDALGLLAQERFDITVTAFNLLEFLLLFGVGGATALANYYDSIGRDTGAPNRRSADSR